MQAQPTAVASLTRIAQFSSFRAGVRQLLRGGVRSLTASALLSCSFVFLTVTALAAPQAQARIATYNLDIPAQNLNSALQELALASQHKLFYKAELIEGKTAPALKGDYTAEQ